MAYGRVFIGNINGRVLALDRDSGEVAWVRVLDDYVYASPAVAGRLVYVGSYDHRLYALDAVTGAVRWSFDAGERISGSASVIGDVVYVSTLARVPSQGRTFGLDAATGGARPDVPGRPLQPRRGDRGHARDDRGADPLRPHPAMTVGRLARAAAIVAIFGLVSRLLGFAREVVLAASFGATGATDAFVNSLLIVNSIAAILLYTLVTLIIPVFQRERAERGDDSAWRLVSALAVWAGGFLIVLCDGGGDLAGGASAALFQLDASRAAQTAELIRIMAPALALQGFSAIFTAMLQIHGRFAGPAAVGVAFNLGIIVGVVIGRGSIGIEAAGWGVVVGATLQVLLQLPQFWRLLRESRTRPALTHPGLGAVGLLALPVLGASILQQINNFTDKLFASSLEAGRVSALSFANALGQAPRVALLLPLLTPLFPLIARLVSEGREREALRAFRRVAGLLALVSIPMMVLLAVYSRETAQLGIRPRQVRAGLRGRDRRRR